MSRAKILKELLKLASDAPTPPKKKTKQTEAEKKKIGGKEKKITGVGRFAEPDKGAKIKKVKDEQKHKGLDKPKMGDFAKGQARGAKKAEKNMTPMQRLQREYEGLTKAAKMKEVSKGRQSKYFSVIRKIGKGYASGGSGEGIDPKSIKSKGQFENLLAKGKLEHIPNAKLVDIAIKVGYVTGDEMMGNAKGGAMMKKKGMAMGGMKKKGMMAGGLKKPAAGQTGLKKLPTPVRNKMGYAKKGGSMKKKGYAMGGMKKKGYAAGGMSVTYRVGGMAKGKMYGSVDNKKKK
tara:strand:+ start:2212 stop:3081 length:870 start_codon:yes stop_codon:yes gene_type:complete